MRSLLVLLAALAVAPVARAVSVSEPKTEAAAADPKDEIPDFKPETGKVTVGDNLATIEVPKGLGYFQQKGARFVVEKIWNNPPDEKVIGLIVPMPDEKEGEDEKDDPSKNWGIIVMYEDSGHVSDSDAADIKYDELLTEMQKDSKQHNEERKKAGYPSVDLLGWAEQPHYDSATHKLYWAKKLQFEGDPKPTLNYDVRVLGRKGVLVLQAVAEVDQLTSIAEASKQVLAKTEFASGHRYAEFDSSIDKVAAYGIGGLIAGKVLLKTGFLAVLLKGLGAFIKPLIAAGAAAVAGIAKLFGGGKKNDPQA